jgi:hypothetical protein
VAQSAVNQYDCSTGISVPLARTSLRASPDLQHTAAHIFRANLGGL